MYRIETVSQQDIPQIKALIHQTIQYCYPQIYSPKVVRFFLEYHKEKELMARNKQDNMVKLSVDGDIVATGYLRNMELGGVYVYPSQQKNGYGNAIVQHLLNLARSNKQSCVWLDATPTSLPFYLKLSFTVVSPMLMRVENETLAYYKMQKHLI